MRPYLILVHDYRRTSAGIRALHKLCHYLNDAGCEAYITPAVSNPIWDTPIADEETQRRVCQDGIVVYPEVEAGNPLGARRVARYLLNRPGLIRGDREFAPEEMLFCYCGLLRQFVPFDDRILTVPVIETSIFNNKKPAPRRNQGAVWMGKGARTTRIPETNDLTEITLEWPTMRQLLASLFRTSEVFYSYADYTALTTEARLCGCPTVIIPSGQYTWLDFESGLPGGVAGLALWTAMALERMANLDWARRTVGDFSSDYLAYEAEFGNQLERFIGITQGGGTQ